MVKLCLREFVGVVVIAVVRMNRVFTIIIIVIFTAGKCGLKFINIVDLVSSELSKLTFIFVKMIVDTFSDSNIKVVIIE